MSTPRENTDVLKMVRDFRESVQRSAFIASKSDFNNSKDSTIATCLNFSNVDTSSLSSSRLMCTGSSKQDIVSLKRQLLDKEADLQHSKGIIAAKEAIISTLEPSNKRICLELEKDLEQTKQQNEVHKQHIDDLRSQLKFHMNKENELSRQLLECKEHLDNEHNAYDLKLKAMQKNYDQLKLKFDELKTEKDDIIRSLNKEINRLSAELRISKQNFEESDEHISILMKQLQRYKSRPSDENNFQQLQEAQKRIKELENEIAENEDAALVVRTMHSELNNVSELKKENSQLKDEINRLRETAENIELLKEKTHSLQEQVSRKEQLNRDYIKLQIEHQHLQDRLNQWENLTVDTWGSMRSPATLSKTLSMLQKNEALLTDQVSKLKMEITSLESDKQKLSEDLFKAKDELKNVSQSFDNQLTQTKRLQRKLLLFVREKECYKSLIDSYESETTMCATTLNKNHIQDLEAVISRYKNVLEKMENEQDEYQKQLQFLQNQLQSNKNESEELKKLTEEKQQLESKVTQLQVQVEEFHKERINLDEQVRQLQKMNEENKPNMKIIHFRNNPLDMAIEERKALLVKLKQENAELKARVKILEENPSQLHDVTARVHQQIEEQNPNTVEDLRNQVQALEKKVKRLLEAFRKTSQEFREVCYMLTGYRIDVPTQKKYKISHMYAESPEEFLLFELSEGSLHMLETSYSQSLGQLINTYLQCQDSIPAFLSSLTLDLFSRQTCVIKTHDIPQQGSSSI